MNHIQKHLDLMLAGDKTTLANMSDELLAEISSVNLDPKALERLGRHILATISADLKSGLHAQKAMHNAMKAGQK